MAPGAGKTLAVCALLVVAVGAVYLPVRDHDFVPFDDDVYVVENPHVRAGLTWRGVAWALTEPLHGFRIPATQLSYLIDGELFGVDAGATLLVNAGLHALASALLFLALRGLGGSFWPSAFVAGTFALHPLHVESVAWASERKDVLCGVFWMLALLAHARFAAEASGARYAALFAATALALAAKPMAVTLPFVLLLLDFWPLRRLAAPGSRRLVEATALRRALMEKLPLFALSLLAVGATLATKHAAGALASTETASLPLRIANALWSYVRYLRRLFWPDDLAVFYPYPWDGIPVEQTLGAAALLAAVTALALRQARRRPHLLVGWLWFVGTLIPVLGLVQAGMQAMADRFSYLPSIGISMALAWEGARWARRGRGARAAVAALALAALVALGVAARLQVRHWRDGVTLFEHALRVVGGDPTLRAGLGMALLREGRVEPGVRELAAALDLGPAERYPRVAVANALTQRARAERRAGRPVGAIVSLRAALAVQPGSALRHAELADALRAQGRLDEALAEFRAARDLDPELASAHAGIGAVLAARGRTREAARHYREALRRRPGWMQARRELERLEAESRGSGTAASP